MYLVPNCVAPAVLSLHIAQWKPRHADWLEEMKYGAEMVAMNRLGSIDPRSVLRSRYHNLSRDAGHRDVGIDQIRIA